MCDTTDAYKKKIQKENLQWANAYTYNKIFSYAFLARPWFFSFSKKKHSYDDCVGNEFV